MLRGKTNYFLVSLLIINVSILFNLVISLSLKFINASLQAGSYTIEKLLNLSIKKLSLIDSPKTFAEIPNLAFPLPNLIAKFLSYISKSPYNLPSSVTLLLIAFPTQFSALSSWE